MNPEVTRRITEWQPTSLRDGPGILFFASVVAVVVLLARRGRSVPWPTLAWLGVFFVIGAYAARGIAWWPLGAVAALAGLLGLDASDQPERPERAGTPTLRRLNTVFAGAIVVAGIVFLPIWRPIDPGTRAPAGVVSNAPPGITAALRDLARPGDKLLNPQVWGSWFEFALPDVLVAIDSRIEFFPPAVWDAYDRAMSSLDGGARQIREWGVTIAAFEDPDHGLADRLDGIGWRIIYVDGDGLIMVSPNR
jgi:hypothetical protein